MVVSQYERISQNYGVGDTLTAERMNEFNSDLSALFARMDSRNISVTYDAQGFLTTFTDTINNITVNIDRTEWNNDPAKLYIQEDGDTNRFAISYNTLGFPISILYGP